MYSFFSKNYLLSLSWMFLSFFWKLWNYNLRVTKQDIYLSMISVNILWQISWQIKRPWQVQHVTFYENWGWKMNLRVVKIFWKGFGKHVLQLVDGFDGQATRPSIPHGRLRLISGWVSWKIWLFSIMRGIFGLLTR